MSTFAFAFSSFNVNEGTSQPTITVNRTSGFGEGSVTFYTAPGTAEQGVDYEHVPGEIVYFHASETAATVYLPNIIEDLNVEGNETVYLKLKDPTTGTELDTATLTIQDNDTTTNYIQFQSADSTVNENVGQAIITLQRNTSSGVATVTYATSSLNGNASPGSGGDYTAVSGTVTFQSGSLTATFQVPISDDAYPEPEEFLFLNLSYPSSGYTISPQAKLRIADNDPPTLTTIADQLLSPTDVRNLTLTAYDPGAQALSFSHTVGTSTLAQDVYTLDQNRTLQKYPDSLGYRYNIHNLGEKWLYNGGSDWYYILTTGQLYKLLGPSPNTATDTLIATLSPIIWQDPRLLHEASAAAAPPSGITSLSGSTLTIDPPSTYNTKIFAVTVTVSDGNSPAQTTQQTFHVGVINDPPTLFDVTDRRVLYTNSLSITPVATDPNPGQTKTWSITKSSYAGAYSLDQSLGLQKYPDSQGYRYNIHSLGEKWLYNGGSDWYYILPTGKLYKLLGGSPNPASDTLTASFSPIFWEDPRLLDSATAADDINQAGVSINTSTGVITIDSANNDYIGVVEITVSVSDGYDSASETFFVGVYADPISLDAISDQKIGPSGTVSLTAAGYDPNSQTLTYSISQGVSALAQQVYSLDQELGLIKWPDTDGYRENLHVTTAKWLYSTTTNLWFYLLSDGTLHRYNGESPVSSAPTYAQLSPIVWQDPRFLHEATVAANPTTVGVSTSINSSTGALTVDPPASYSGIFAVTAKTANSVQAATRTFHVGVTNEPVTLTAIADRIQSTSNTISYLTASDNDSSAQTLSWAVSHVGYGGANSLDQEYGLARHEGGYYQNVHGANEKWLYNSTYGQWFYILPNGELHRLGSPLSGQLLATLSPIFWQDPRLLHDATAPQNLVSTTVQVDGALGYLYVNPPSGYLGVIQATVYVSDGPSTTNQTFLIAIRNPPTDISLSGTTVVENSPANGTVGTLSTTDADTLEAHTYTLVSGTGSTDNAAFTISGTTLKLKASPDYEFQSTYYIRVRSTDMSGLYIEEPYTITVVRNQAAITSISTDSGASATDEITSDQTLVFTGTAPANSTVKVYRPGDDLPIGTVTANGSGAWSFDWTGTTLAEGSHAFWAVATLSNVSSDRSSLFPVTVDITTPTVTVEVPATTGSLRPEVEVRVFDLVGLASGATVTLDVDLNNDGDFADTSESGHGTVSLQTSASGILQNGYARLALNQLPSIGLYRLRARVTDLAGNSGTSATQNFEVVTSSWGLGNAAALTSDGGAAREHLGVASAAHGIDLDLSPGSGQAGNPALVYDGRSVSPRPVIQAQVTTPNGASLPSLVGVELIWDGTSQGTTNYATTGLAPGDLLTVAAQVGTPVTATGRHAWELRVKVSGQSDLVSSGATFVVVNDAGPFGAGWNLSTLNRLLDIAADANGPAGKLWMYGSGGWRFFAGTSGTLTSPAEDNGTLVKNGNGSFTYTTPEQTKLDFDSSGYQTGWTSTDGKETIAFSYTSGLLTGLTAVDGGTSTFSYSSGKLTSIAAPVTSGTRTFTASINGSGDLASVTNPDTGVHAFEYASHRMTRETFAGLENRWQYDSGTGLLNQHRWGTSSSPSVFTLAPQAALGLGGLVRGQPLAMVTDALGNVGGYRFDVQGRALLSVNAEGGKTVWTRDTAGRVATVKDPLGRTTSYTRDSKGYVTLETLPDTSTRGYTYHSTWHTVTQYTDERGKLTQFGYDASNGHLLTVTNALTAVTTYVYSGTSGLLDTITEPLGKVTTVTWDSNRRRDLETTKFGTTVLAETDYGYDTRGYLSTLEDAQGLVTTLTNDTMGRVTSQQVGTLPAAVWVYSGAGLLTGSTDESGVQGSYAFDSYGRGLAQVTSDGVGTSLARTTDQTYDDAGRLTGMRDALNNWTTFTLDSVGRTVKTVDATGATTLGLYNLGGELIASSDAHGNKSSYTYNSRGWVTHVTDSAGKTVITGYDAAGNGTSYTDKAGKVWTTEYNDLGRVKKEIDPLLHAVETIYWSDGRVKEVKDAKGIITRFDVDFTNRVETVTEAYGTSLARTSKKYFDNVGFVTQVEDALGHDTYYIKDALHRVDLVKDHNLVVKLDYDYDSAGRLQKIKDGLAEEATTYTRDALGRVIKTTDANNHESRVTLDANGRTVESFDGANQKTQTRYDNLGRVTYTIDATGGLTKYEYDEQGNLSALTDAAGNTTRWVYDTLGRQIKEIDPQGEVRTWTYNDLGQVVSSTDKLGRYKAFAYYDNGLLHTETWKTSSTGSTVNVITLTYDENDRPLTVTDNAGAITWTYDDLSRMATQTDIHALTLSWAYDAAGRISTLSDSFGGVVTYGWDVTNRLTSRSFSDGTAQLRIGYQYNDRNDVTQVDRYSDAAGSTLIGKTLYTRDDGGRLTAIAHKNAANTVQDSFNYTFDAADRVTQETSTLGPTRNYTYDVTNQLLADGTDTYSFDLNGNRTMSGYTTDVGNLITTDGTWNYTHDDEGNIIKKVHGTTDETWLYSFDHNNRLTKVERKASQSGAVNLRVEFAYDVLNNRIKKTLDADGDGSGTATIEKYAFDPHGNPWADMTSAGALTTRRLYADALDAVFAKIGTTGNEVWYAGDNLGSARDLINSTGSIINHRDWDSFGKLVTETQPSNTDRFGFAGFEHDTDINLAQNGLRWYSFDIGQWISQDPIGFRAGDTNLSRYVNNSPTNFTDPNGETALGLSAFGPAGVAVAALLTLWQINNFRGAVPVPRFPSLAPIGARESDMPFPARGLLLGPEPPPVAVRPEELVPSRFTSPLGGDLMERLRRQQIDEFNVRVSSLDEAMRIVTRPGVENVERLIDIMVRRIGGDAEARERLTRLLIAYVANASAGGGGRLVVGGGRATGFPQLDEGDVALNIAPSANPHVVGDIRTINPNTLGQFNEVFFEGVPFDAINAQAARNAAAVLRSGGRVSIITGRSADRAALRTSLEQAGFTNVEVLEVGSGTRAYITATGTLGGR